MCIYGNYSFDKPLFCLGKETAGLKSRGVAIRWLRSPVFSDSQSAILAVQPYSRLCFFFFILCFFLKKKTTTHTHNFTSEKLILIDILEGLSLWQGACTQVQKALLTGIPHDAPPAYFCTGKEVLFQFTLGESYLERYSVGCLSGTHPYFPLSVRSPLSWGGAGHRQLKCAGALRCRWLPLTV